MKERLLLKSETIPVIPDHVRFEYDEKGKKWNLENKGNSLGIPYKFLRNS